MSQTNEQSKSPSSSSRVWLITGSSSGFGRTFTEAALAHGDRVVASARQPERLQDLSARYPDRLLTPPLDVTDEEQCQAAVAHAMQRFGQIDVLVNNAGYGILGAIEEVNANEARQLFETNFFGLLNVTRAVLPVMRTQRRGHILMISSLSGHVGTPGGGLYSASKFAVEGAAEALAHEAAPLGIRVTLVEPGVFRTGVLGRSQIWAKREIEDYAQLHESLRQSLTQLNGKEPNNPTLAAAALIKIVETPEPPLRLALGVDALETIRKKLADVSHDLEMWETTSVATAFPSNTASSS